MPRILVVDDHAVVRKGVVEMLKRSDASISVDEAGNGEEALARILLSVYELILLDISMPGQSGLQVLKEIKGRLPRLPVLMLSVHREEEYALRALNAGASGYVTKDDAAEELIGAVRKVLGGGRYVSASLAGRVGVDTDGDVPIQ
jgi:two-component system invasion response regulator UvrY